MARIGCLLGLVLWLRCFGLFGVRRALFSGAGVVVCFGV